MDENTFIKEMSKYPKEVILKTISENYYFEMDRISMMIKHTDVKHRFNKLMKQSEEIEKQAKQYMNKNDSSSFLKYVQLMEEDNKIHEKIDEVIKEMNAYKGMEEGDKND